MALCNYGPSSLGLESLTCLGLVIVDKLRPCLDVSYVLYFNRLLICLGFMYLFSNRSVNSYQTSLSNFPSSQCSLFTLCYKIMRGMW